ncbi:MAG: FmdB family zinc ribbon protein [Mycobacteriaceae bacterium]
MPTYSYACTECDNRFDAVQAFTEDALTTCPKCSGRLRKLFNSVGVVFKGSGFYRTDSRESAKSSVSSDSGSSSGSEKTGSEKTGSDKTGSEKTGSDKTGSDKTGTAKPGSGSSTPSSSASAPASN